MIGIMDVTQLSLAELGLLDGGEFANAIEPLLRRCGSNGTRRWDDGPRALPCGSAPSQSSSAGGSEQRNWMSGGS
jgi:hypothetical protein